MSIPMSMGMEMGMENPLNKEKRKKPTPGELMFNLHAMTYPWEGAMFSVLLNSLNESGEYQTC